MIQMQGWAPPLTLDNKSKQGFPLGALYGLQAGIGLAPMEGVTDFPTRLWFRLVANPDFLVTPFLRVTPTYPGREEPVAWAPELYLPQLAGVFASPTIPQLMAAESDAFIRAALPLLANKAPIVELNCGCPAPGVSGKGAGSGLLKEVTHFHRFIADICAGVGAPKLSIKMRTGFEDAAAFPELVACLTQRPLHRLVVHGRTRADRYRGQARWDLIAQVAEATSYPVIGSGDITDQGSLERRLAEAPQVKGVIIGRGALRNPLIFEALRQGKALSLDSAALTGMLEAYALLHELAQIDRPKLIALAADGHFSQPIFTDADRWRQCVVLLRRSLQAAALAGAQANGELSLRSLGRLKMLWNYLRSSLAPSFFEPRLLRCRSLPDFFALLASLQQSHATSGAGSDLNLAWQQEHDWMFAGEKNSAKVDTPAPAAGN